MRLRGLLHEASDAPQESEAEVRARRKAAANTVKELTAQNPEAMAAMFETILRANPAQQLMRPVGETAPSGEAEAAEPPDKDKAGADPSEAEYQKLYAYNLGLTGDRARLEAEERRSSESPLQALLGGQSVKIDPADLRAALAIGMASAGPGNRGARARESSGVVSGTAEGAWLHVLDRDRAFCGRDRFRSPHIKIAARSRGDCQAASSRLARKSIRISVSATVIARVGWAVQVSNSLPSAGRVIRIGTRSRSRKPRRDAGGYNYNRPDMRRTT